MLPASFNPQLPPGSSNPPEAASSTAVVPYPGLYSEQQTNDTEQVVQFSHYMWVLRRHRWKILGFVLASVIAAVVVTERMTPIYESTATLDVDREMPQQVVGQQQNASVVDAEAFLTTQVQLVESDTVLRPVAERYNLLHTEHQLGDSRQTDARKADAPIVLKKMKVLRPQNTYLIQISYRSPNPQLAADVANGIARSYIEATYNIRFQSTVGLSSFMEKQIDELKAKMERSSEALARFERDLNVINPEEKTSILSARLLQLNTEYTTAQADRVRKEAAWRSLKDESPDSALSGSNNNDALRMIKEQLNIARQKFTDAASHYGVNHPEYKKAAGQVAELTRELQEARDNALRGVQADYEEAVSREQLLQKTVAETKSEFDDLNARSFQYQELKREADADKKLYDELVEKIKEAGINAGFQGSSIRLADMARPGADPVSPKLMINLIIASLLSLVFGAAAALASELMDNTVRDPEQVRRLLNTQVVGILPRAKTRERVAGKGEALQNGDSHNSALMLLSDASNKDVTGYIESIRTLRNSILLNDFDRAVNSLLVTSAAPKEGKTTTAVHLALSHAEQRNKTLLVDCDLRRPTIHKYFNLPSSTPGVSEIVTNGIPWRSLVQKIETVPDLHVLAGGVASRLAADLVGRELHALLEDAKKEYDLIVIDGPPILGFAEPLQLASAADSVVVVTLAGETNRQAVAKVLETLNHVRARVSGIVLNRMAKDISDGYYYYGYYGKYYKYYSKYTTKETQPS